LHPHLFGEGAAQLFADPEHEALLARSPASE